MVASVRGGAAEGCAGEGPRRTGNELTKVNNARVIIRVVRRCGPKEEKMVVAVEPPNFESRVRENVIRIDATLFGYELAYILNEAA